MAWGILSTCTGAVQSYGGLLACRFILGFVEAAYFVSGIDSTAEYALTLLNSQAAFIFCPPGTQGKNLANALPFFTLGLYCLEPSRD